MSRQYPILVLAAALPLSAALAAQAERAPVQISVSADPHREAEISPDGVWVAYLVPGKLQVVDIQGSAARTLVNNVSVSSYVWATDSRSIFYVDGTDVLRVQLSGGNPVTILQTSATGVNVWSVDSRNRTLFCTRFQPTSRNYHVFSISTSGGQNPVDLVTSTDILGNVQVDPSDSWLLFSTQGNQPFDPITFWRIDVQASGNAFNMAGGDVGLVANNPRWIDNGDTMIFAGLDQAGTPQVLRIDRQTQSVVPLTSFSPHQRCNVSGDGEWLVFEAIDGVGGNGPGVMPVQGGGLNYMFTRRQYTYSGSATIDDAGNAVVISAARTNIGENAKLWRYDLDGEMRVYPRAEIGNPLVFELPAAASEVGVIFLGTRGTPFALPPAQFHFQLDPSFIILTIAVGGQNPIQTTVPIPNFPPFQGLRLYYQGLRWDPTAQAGEMTRYGVFTIF